MLPLLLTYGAYAGVAISSRMIGHQQLHELSTLLYNEQLTLQGAIKRINEAGWKKRWIVPVLTGRLFTDLNAVGFAQTHGHDILLAAYKILEMLAAAAMAWLTENTVIITWNFINSRLQGRAFNMLFWDDVAVYDDGLPAQRSLNWRATFQRILETMLSAWAAQSTRHGRWASSSCLSICCWWLRCMITSPMAMS